MVNCVNLLLKSSINIDPKQISNISDIRLVIESIMVRALHSNEQFSNSLGREFAGFAFGQGKHRALHEVELLLEVVEADACIDFVPVEDLRLVGYLGVGTVIDSFEAAINILVVENVEQLLE